MRLIGLLAWFDEPARDLERAITTFNAAGITHLVAVDGAYGLFPDGQPCSPPGQVEHIREVCDELGIPLTVHQPDTTWATETEKRAHMFTLGEQHYRRDNEDWYCVIDADEHVRSSVNLPAILARTTLNAASVTFHEPAGGGKPTRQFEIRCLFRALPGLTVKHNHHTYLAGDRCLWGHGQEPAADLTFVTVVHTTNQRPARRRRIKHQYYRDRDRTGIETQAGCIVCGQPSTIDLRASFEYDSQVDLLRSNAVLTCDRHAQRIRFNNRHALAKLTADVMAGAPAIFDPNEVVTRLVVHLDAHEKLAPSFGITRPELVHLVERELDALLAHARAG